MNRVKLWVFTLLVVGVGAAWLQASSSQSVARSMESLDARLQAAKSFADFRTRLLSREVASIATAAARDPALESVSDPAKPPLPETPKGRRGQRFLPQLPPPAPSTPPAVDPVPVAEAAARIAAQAVGIDPNRGFVAGLIHSSRLFLRTSGRDIRLEDDAAAAASLLEAAQNGRIREAYVRAENVLYLMVAIPVDSGVAVVAGLPVDLEWAHSIHAATDVDVTFSLDNQRVVSTATPNEAKELLAAATQSSSRSFNVGKLASFRFRSGGARVSLLFGKAGMYRAQTMPLPDGSGNIVLSRSTLALLDPIAAEQRAALLGLVGLLILGVVLGFLVKNETPLAIPKDLLMAADRIGHGEYSVRAPVFAGQLGTLANALNQAAAAASSRPEPPSPQPVETGMPLQEAAPAGDSFLPPAPPPTMSERETTAPAFYSDSVRATAIFAPPMTPTEAESVFSANEPLPAAAEQPAEGSAPSLSAQEPSPEVAEVGQSMVESPPPALETASEPEPEPATEPAPEPTTEPALESAPEPPQTLEPMAEIAEPAELADVDEDHWRQVFEEFLLIRRQCGEPSDGLTYEKFRQKLQRNRDSLIEKYGCKAVRFHAYMKDSKAALKATPVR